MLNRGGRVCIVGGAGHVGLPLAMTLADCGLTVDIVDTNLAALAEVSSGKMPFREEGGPEMLQRALASGRLRLTDDHAAIARAEGVICVIGTPVDEYLTPRTTRFCQVIEHLRPHFRDGQTLILRSTVYPGLSAQINRMFREHGPDVHVSFCPERVAEGHALREIREIPQIISAFDDAGLAGARRIFGRVCRELVEVAPMEAELAKLMCNCYRYISFAIANQFYMLAEGAGLDYERVAHAASWHNPRSGGMPRPGLAAGPCLLKDTMQLAAFADNNFFLGHAAMLINEGLPQFMVRQLQGEYDLHHATVGILGMTFKADCDDTRDSLSFKLRKLLQLAAHEVLVHDPFLAGAEYLPLPEVIGRSNILVVGVPHSAYRGLSIPAGKRVLDIWHCLAPQQEATITTTPAARLLVGAARP